MRPDLEKFCEAMNKKFGVNAMRPGSNMMDLLTNRIKTGSISLDAVLGGGLPFGRFIQYSGEFSTGKSTMGYHAVRNAQAMEKEVLKTVKQKILRVKQPFTVSLTQTESNSYTEDYAQHIGINTDALLLNESAGMEEGLEILVQGQRMGLIDFALIDSLEGFIPMKEYNSGMDETIQMGMKQKLFGEYFRKFSAGNNKLMREGKMPMTLLGINQLREKMNAHGDPSYEPGGKAIGFFASITVRFRKGDWIKSGKGVKSRIIGQQVKFRLRKNKVGLPQRAGMYDFYFGEGGTVDKGFVDTFKEAVMEAVAFDIIKKSGSWFVYNKEKIQGTDALIAKMRQNDEIFEELQDKLYEAIHSGAAERQNIEEFAQIEKEFDEEGIE